MKARFVRVAFCAITLMWLAATGHAQFKASIQGTVKDTSGAVISGATVTVTNQETNRSQQVTSSDEGFYRVSGLAPGRYMVTAELTGFRKKVLEDVIIHAEETQGIDIVLEPGQITEAVTVTVDAATTQLDSEHANIDRAITTQEVRRIPQVGRDPYELIRLTPGVFGSGARGANGGSVGLPNTTGPGGSDTSIFQVENQVPITANGQRVSANNYQIDGVSVNSLGHGGAAVVTPNQESVKEMRVLSSAYSAEYGRNTGAQIQVVSQNGTNEFHGSAVFKYNDPGLNAFNKFGDIFGGPRQRVNRRFRQFGGSLGGPIIRDNLFFFFSYEGLRERTTDTLTRFVETPQFRQAVISQRPNSDIATVFSTPGIEPRIISNVAATCVDFIAQGRPCREVPGGLDIGSLTGRTGEYVSLGNPGGGGLDNVPDILLAVLAVPNRARGDQYNTRIDFNRGTTDQFAVSAYFTKRDDTQSDPGGQSRPLGDLRFNPLNSAATVTWIRTISATMLNEARANFTRFSVNQVEASGDTNFGIPRIEVEGLPLLPGGERIRFGAPRAETTPGIFAQNTFEVRDVLSKLWGNHALRFGGEIRKEQDNNNLAGGARPVFSFVGLFNLANETPIFEAINADPRTGLPADAQRYFRTSTYAFFVQDDWKVRPNLTLNFGLRYEYFTPLREKRDRISNIEFPAGALAQSRVTVSDELFEPDRNNFAPRLGFAWSPGRFENNLVVRGGFGLAYNRTPNILFANTRGNPPFFARFNICCGTAPTDFGTPFADGRILFAVGADTTPFSYPVNPALAQGIDPDTGGVANNTVEIYGTERDLPNAYVYSYSLDTEYLLPGNFIAGLGYQGSSSHKLIRIADLTLIFPLNPRFDPVFFLIPDVNANYNALLARLSRAFAQGFRFDAVYRWSKSIDTLSFEGPGGETNQTFPADQRTERGPSDYDVKHHFVLSGLWDLPIFRGRSDWVGKLLGGWQINGIFTKHSGFPWSPKIFNALRQPSGKFFGPIRPRAYFGGAGDNTSDRAFLTGSNFPGGGANFFDTTVLGDPPTFELNPPGVGRNSFRGPKYSSLDLSLVKQTGLPDMPGIGEGANLELRANFFNAFNQLNLAPIRFFDPGAIITDPNFGRSTRALSGRVIELQARFSF
ncbi:MAG TPA: TonB-dependent receptor [Blastocatellia bacterium]|nr:TonB-dependent receptor [Blastocatellia bacterium]